MSKIQLEDCAHCLGSGEEIKHSPTGTPRVRSCRRCRGLGQVETVVNSHYVNEDLFEY
jgi:DnaJ-class molecular chaperone